jgi:hypothetical protein
MREKDEMIAEDLFVLKESTIVWPNPTNWTSSIPPL